MEDIKTPLKITIKNVASFDEDGATLELKKQFNLIYGLNGTGKTTISNYLQDLERDDISRRNIEGFNADNQKILVYNQRFIKENFYDINTQKGIFNLSKDNKHALENIQTATEKNKKLDDKNKELQNQLDNEKDSIAENLNNAKEEIWEINKQYKGTAGFLNGLRNRKENLFNHLLYINLEEPHKTIEEIEKELQELGDSATERDELSIIDFMTDLSIVEQNDIFREEIIGNEHSSVSHLITTLKNSDWVKQGLEYVHLKEKNCPFCQQETLTNELIENIENYFDKTYDTKIQNLKQLQENYTTLKEKLHLSDYKKEFFTQEQYQEIENLFTKFNAILKNNLNIIETKISKPSQTVQLQSSKEALEKVNTWIKKSNEDIQEFNYKLDNREQTIKALKTEFWKIQRKEYNQTITRYKSDKSELEKSRKSIEDNIKKTDEDIRSQNKIIQDNQAKVSNIDETIKAINNHLIGFGMNEFSIIKHQENENEYKIKRGEENTDSIFKSLSEGEKTVISFLYFVELCKGKESKEDTKQKIIVIDDPISSLSHMHVLNIAQLIKSTFIKNENEKDFLQCFILTHSLYFFNELKRCLPRQDEKTKETKKQYQLFRIFKNDFSKITEMQENEILNDYQAYWQIIKDSKKDSSLSNNTKYIIANVMRNIIEHFFSFTKKEDLNTVFKRKEFQENKYQSFERYMNRESHSDAVNLTDYKEFDINVFQEAFKKMFTGYEKHYNAYMNDKEST